ADLTWTAPGDDGTIATIAPGTFKIQYSSWTNWWDIEWSTASAETVTISTTGIKLGDTCSTTVGGLTKGVTYYFRIWTADEVPNWSGECTSGATAWIKVNIFFSDDFESWTATNIGPWDIRDVDENCFASTTTFKKDKFYGFECIDSSGGAGGQGTAHIREYMTLGSTSYVRFYAYFKDDFFDQGSRVIMNYEDVDFNPNFYLATLTNKKIRLYSENAASDTQDSEVTLSSNTWHCFEVRTPTPTASSSIQWWIDGVKQPEITGD
ncbi:unnamed protein product, partial [marine sediment metagenome]